MRKIILLAFQAAINAVLITIIFYLVFSFMKNPIGYVHKSGLGIIWITSFSSWISGYIVKTKTELDKNEKI